MQVLVAQSFGVWPLTAAEPAGTLLIVQLLAVQALVAQGWSMPGHWVGLLHCTQTPVAEQTLPLPQAVLSGSCGWVGLPATQTSPVQGLPSSSGVSLLKGAVTTPPVLLQTWRTQSFGFALLTTVPLGW